MGYIISMVNMKGGVGKTTITINLATCLAKNHRKKVLVVDLDTQINATLSLMSPGQFAKLKQEKCTLKTLVDRATNRNFEPDIIPLEKIIQKNVCKIAGLDLLPGDLELYDDYYLAEIVYGKSQGERLDFKQNWYQLEDRLMRGILQETMNQYDWIFLDFSPGDNLITRSGILASNLYIIPAKAEPLSMIGIGILEGRIRQLKASDRTKINLLGIILTSLGRTTNMAENIKDRLIKDFGKDAIFNTEIPTNVAVARAVDEYQPVVLTEPKSSGAKAFNDLAKEFIKRFNLVRG